MDDETAHGGVAQDSDLIEPAYIKHCVQGGHDDFEHMIAENTWVSGAGCQQEWDLLVKQYL